MDIQKLFETQKILRDRIDYNEPDRFNKLVLALLVEVGECANEWRGFKFWSKDQKPRTTESCGNCLGEGKGFFSGKEWTGHKELCVQCGGTGRDKNKNPLLEEYVDGLHFVLELGLEMNCRPEKIELMKNETVTDCFIDVMELATEFEISPGTWNYSMLFERYIELGEQLGFTWDEVEQAYYEKNQINHQRQENGY